MPIRREHRGFYPIDWPELSRAIRFGRARGRCEACGKPHRSFVFHLQDGRWWDAQAGAWRDGAGQPAAVDIGEALPLVRRTRVFLATAHKNHDTSDNRPANLAAWCQRCHLLHDRPEHARRRRITILCRRAIGDFFRGLYPR